MTRTDRQILHIALPSIVSNITVPLLGLIDVSIVGHLGAASYIGAIAVGGMLFNMIYWLFGFLRMGTGGLTAQAYGRHDLQEVTRILLRSLSISLWLALALLILQYPVRSLAFMLMDTSEEVRSWPRCISISASGGAPATPGALRVYRLVYRHAEFPISHVHSHYTERGEHRRQPFSSYMLSA